MSKAQEIFEATVVIIGIVALVGWLWVMFSIAGAPTGGERMPTDCFTPAGDPC